MKSVIKYREPSKLSGLSYDQQTIFSYRDSGKILCMRLDLSYKCNLDCKYCYTKELIVRGKKEATYDELINTIEQGISLGIKSVVILGGEPLIYPHIFELLYFLSNKNIIPVMFTNAILITKDIAQKLYDLNVSVVVKFDGFNEIQDILCGSGFSLKRQYGLTKLIDVGFIKYPANSLRLGCASVVTKINFHEIEKIWKYFRTQNIFPHIERVTVMNKKMKSLSISNSQAGRLLNNLRKIDEMEFGIQWKSPYPVIPGYNCSIFYTGVHINPYLEVSACPELPPIHSLREKKLNDIIKSNYFQRTRNIDKYIKGKCSNCIYLKNAPCYGCRSKVFRKTGSIFDEDSECYINIKNKS